MQDISPEFIPKVEVDRNAIRKSLSKKISRQLYSELEFLKRARIPYERIGGDYPIDKRLISVSYDPNIGFMYIVQDLSINGNGPWIRAQRVYRSKELSNILPEHNFERYLELKPSD